MCKNVVQIFRSTTQVSTDEMSFLPETSKIQMKYCNVFFGKETGALMSKWTHTYSALSRQGPCTFITPVFVVNFMYVHKHLTDSGG
jgi:hypothetical protein